MKSIKLLLKEGILTYKDAWHFLSHLDGKWKTFISLKTDKKCCDTIYKDRKRKCDHCGKSLEKGLAYENLSKLSVHEVKKHFLFGLNDALNTQMLFDHMIQFIDYLSLNNIELTEIEQKALYHFCSEIFDEEIIKFFKKDKSTSEIESFNFTSNKFLQKGKNYNKTSFIHRKHLAILIWNWRKDHQNLSEKNYNRQKKNFFDQIIQKSLE